MTNLKDLPEVMQVNWQKQPNITDTEAVNPAILRVTYKNGSYQDFKVQVNYTDTSEPLFQETAPQTNPELASQPSSKTEPSSGSTTSAANDKKSANQVAEKIQTSKTANKASVNKQQAQKLPQTGNEQSAILFVLGVLTNMLGLGMILKRRNHKA